MQATKVGIREFRENLANYIYLPTRPKPGKLDLEAFRAAGEKLDALIQGGWYKRRRTDA